MDFEKIQQYKDEQKAKAEAKAQEMADNQRTGIVAESVKQSAKITTVAVQNATKKSADAVKQELKDSGEKVIQAMHDAQAPVADALNNLVLATVISKDPAVIETAKAFANLLNEISKASKEFGSSKLNLLPIANEKLSASIDKLASNVQEKPDKDYTKKLEAIRTQLEKLGKININPVVNVAPAQVDVKPIVKVLKENKPVPAEAENKLEDYKAQDLAGNDTFQYVGFLSPNGGWYIIENDIEGGTLRYAVGVENYKSAWKNHDGLVYRLLNEAINAL